MSDDSCEIPQPIFISYATTDRKRALSICKAIERGGEKCWIACRDVAPAHNYQESIARAIRDARALVLVFSGAANGSDEIKKELSLASRNRVPVFTLRIEDVQPTDAFDYELSTRQWIDAFGNYRVALGALTQQLKTLPSAKLAPDNPQRFGHRPRTGPRVSRRRALIAGGTFALASTAGFIWFERRDQLPSEAQKLVDDGHAALDEGSIDQLASAASAFQQATKIAPSAAEPWGALALAYERQALLAPQTQEGGLHLRGAEARQRALSIDPNNGDALASGTMAIPMYQNWLSCERACRAALERAPHHPTLNTWMAMVLGQVGRERDCLTYVDRAIEANPKFLMAYFFKVPLLEDLNRIGEADAIADLAIRIWPRNYAMWFTRLYFLTRTSRGAQALAMIDDKDSRPVGIPDWNWALVRLQVKAMTTSAEGDINIAMAQTLATAGRGVGLVENAFAFAATVGRTDDAYRLIEGYFFDRGFKLPEQRFNDEQGTYTGRRKRFTSGLFRRFMRPVQADARFTPLLTAIGLNDYWKRSASRPDYLTWLRTG